MCEYSSCCQLSTASSSSKRQLSYCTPTDLSLLVLWRLPSPSSHKDRRKNRIAQVTWAIALIMYLINLTLWTIDVHNVVEEVNITFVANHKSVWKTSQNGYKGAAILRVNYTSSIRCCNLVSGSYGRYKAGTILRALISGKSGIWRSGNFPMLVTACLPSLALPFDPLR